MNDLHDFRFVVVGSGLFGAVFAERIATCLGENVVVLEKRDHLGGNSFSEDDPETGIEYHRYGSHLFHTSNATVWTYIRRFSDFTNYRHRVFSRVGDRTYTMPINLMTINNFFGVDLDPAGARAFLAGRIAADKIEHPKNFAEKAVSLIGRDLYEAFIEGYTAKQWETDPHLLPVETITRLPVRFNYNDFYFGDLYEGLPVDGYHKLFEKMLGHAKIHTITNCDFFEARHALRDDATIIYTGPIDRFYDYRHGELTWRTLDFEVERLAIDDYQGASVVNYPDVRVPFTRVHEFKHLHPERTGLSGRTLIMREFSRFAGRDDEPFYPIDTPADKETYRKYAALAEKETNVIFGGRLGTYRYLDMHQAIAAALKSFERDLMPLFDASRDRETC